MSESKPEWLPEIVSVNGEWKEVLARLYEIFDRDFHQTGCNFANMPVWWNQRKLEGERYEEGFWHLITKTDQQSNERLLDPRRAERLPWCKPTLTNSSDPQVKVWDYREANNKIRTYVWLENWDYVIVVEKRQHNRGIIAFLITAYHLDYNSTRRNLKAKYEKREGL